MLDQLKGARVELKFANETVTGAIVAARLVPGDDKRPEREQITLLMDTGDLRNLDLGAAAGDPLHRSPAATQFKDYLAALTDARSKEKRSDLYRFHRRQAARSRGQLHDSHAGLEIQLPADLRRRRGQPMLEGWAIVDNTTGEDWNKVDLSLVSGRPISFISRLYEPRYVTRQTAELPDDHAAAPVVYEGSNVDGQHQRTYRQRP